MNKINGDFYKYFSLFIQGIIVFYVFTSIFESSDFTLIANSIVFYTVISFFIGIFQFNIGVSDEYQVVSSNGVEFYSRPIPNGFDPNYYYLNIIFPIVYLQSRQRHVKNIITKFIFWLLILLFFINALFTGSKSAFIITTAVYFYYTLSTFRAFLTNILLLAIFIILILPVIGDFLSFSIIRYQTFFTGDIESITTGRNILWKDSFEVFLENPVFGLGLGQIVSLFSSRLMNLSIGGATTHNTIIHTLAETGILGFTLWASPVVLELKKSFKAKNFTFVLLLTTLTMMLSIDAGYYKIFFLYLGLSYILNDEKKLLEL